MSKKKTAKLEDTTMEELAENAGAADAGSGITVTINGEEMTLTPDVEVIEVGRCCDGWCDEEAPAWTLPDLLMAAEAIVELEDAGRHEFETFEAMKGAMLDTDAVPGVYAKRIGSLLNGLRENEYPCELPEVELWILGDEPKRHPYTQREASLLDRERTGQAETQLAMDMGEPMPDEAVTLLMVAELRAKGVWTGAVPSTLVDQKNNEYYLDTDGQTYWVTRRGNPGEATAIQCEIDTLERNVVVSLTREKQALAEAIESTTMRMDQFLSPGNISEEYGAFLESVAEDFAAGRREDAQKKIADGAAVFTKPLDWDEVKKGETYVPGLNATAQFENQVVTWTHFRNEIATMVQRKKCVVAELKDAQARIGELVKRRAANRPTVYRASWNQQRSGA